MEMPKDSIALDDETSKRIWIDPECVELDIPGVTQVALTNPSVDGLTDLS